MRMACASTGALGEQRAFIISSAGRAHISWLGLVSFDVDRERIFLLVPAFSGAGQEQILSLLRPLIRSLAPRRLA